MKLPDDIFFEILEVVMDYDFCDAILFRHGSLQFKYEQIANTNNVNAMLSAIEHRPSGKDRIRAYVKDPMLLKTLDDALN
jgi:hypothetical protein